MSIENRIAMWRYHFVINVDNKKRQAFKKNTCRFEQYREIQSTSRIKVYYSNSLLSEVF